LYDRSGKVSKGVFHSAAVVTFVLVLAVGFWSWPFTVDDAYVVARYALRLAEGKGYTMNDGPPSDGVTGPLWIVPLAAARALGLDPVVIAKSFGLGCMALAAALLVARSRTRAQGKRVAWTATALLAVHSTPGVWGVAGLETGAATLAFSLAILAGTRRLRPRPLATGLAIACLAWLRPEMALCSAVVLLALLIRHRKAGYTALAVAAAGAVSVVAFRLAMFGSVLPLAFDAKPGPLQNGLQYALVSLLYCTGVAGLWLAWNGASRGGAAERTTALACAVHVVAVLLAGGDWMPGFRLFAPVLPAYAVLAAVGAARVALGGRARACLALAALGVACLPAAVDSAVQLPEVRAAGMTRERAGEPLARWLGLRARRVALVDVGYLAYSSGVEVVDLGGITDPVVAGNRGGHLSKRIDAGYLRRRNPDAVVLHSTRPPGVDSEGRLIRLNGFPVERWVASQPWIRRRFRVARVVPYSADYYYVVLSRDGRQQGGGTEGTNDRREPLRNR
jgi:hypothetical protein